MSAAPSSHEQKPEIITPQRLEAFSDGVIAIAITLLILELRLPELEPGQSLFDALGHVLPNLFALIVSFATIGIMWINHHNIFRIIKHTDQGLLMLNTLLLFMITFINFPTSVLGDYINTPQFTEATVFYSGTLFVTAICFSLLWRYAIYNNRLLGDTPNLAVVQAVSRNYRVGFFAYLATLVIAFISPMLAVFITFGLAIFFALPLNTLLKR